MQLLLHAQQLVALVLIDRRHRHAGPLGDDFVDLLFPDDDLPRAGLDVELRLDDLLQILAGGDFLLAIELRLLVVLLRGGALHLLHVDADALVDFAELLAVARLAQLGARARFVDQIDGLVRQEAVGDIPVRLVHRGFDRFARVFDVMEILVPILHAEQDVDGLPLARRIDLDRLEAALERSILLDVLPILGRSRRADAPDLAPRERRLENVCRIERALGRARADERMELVDEHDDVRVVGQLLHDRLQALFELTTVLRASDDQRNVERENPLVGEEVRHVPVDDLLGESLDDRRLANARLADQDGVVLRPAAQHLLHALQLVLPPDERVELILHRRLGQVAAELGEQRRFFHARERGLLVQELDDVLANRVEAHPLFHEDGCRHRPFFAENAQQEMLGPDVVVQQPIGFFGSKLEDPLGLRAEGNLDRRRHLLAKHGPAFDVLPDVLEGKVRAREDAAGEPLAFPNQPEKQVLGLNGNAAELARLVAGEEQDSPSSFRIAFEHRRLRESRCG